MVGSRSAKCPAVTCTAQATMLTGQSGKSTASSATAGCSATRARSASGSSPTPDPGRAALRHRRPPRRERGRHFACAKLFWWFNQGAAVDISVTPKPHYGADGNKAFGITGTPDGLDANGWNASSAISLSTPSGGRWPACPAPMDRPLRRRGPERTSGPT